MKKLIYKLTVLSLILGSASLSEAQVKKTSKSRKKTHTVAVVPFVEHKYGNPATISEIKDISDSDNSYNSVKSLVEQDKILVSYDDNTFHSKEPLRRGDFVVSLNSALDALKMMKTNMGVDSNLFTPYDRKRVSGNLTSVAQIKDVKETSVYYPAAKSLLENYGVAAPFLNNMMLSPGSIMTEKEVYDILHGTLGFTATGLNPYSTNITRGKFAIALNNAVMQKSEQIADLHAQAMKVKDAQDRAQQAIMAQQQKKTQDSLYKAMETQKFAMAETASKVKTKKHKK